MQMSIVPKKASAVVLVRPIPAADGADGPFEVFLTRRPESMAFAGGNFVFPGGKLDPSDYAPENLALARGMEADQAARILGDGELPERSLGFWLAAIRELFEEAGILLCTTREGGAPDLESREIQARLAAGREEVHQRKRTLASLMREWEVSGVRWIQPAEALGRWRAGEFKMRGPTATTLMYLARFSECRSFLAAARSGKIAFRSLTAE